MFHVPIRPRLFAVLSCLVIASLTWFHFSIVAVQAATGFTPQTRLGFPAGDDWEPALAADHYGHVYVLYQKCGVSAPGFRHGGETPPARRRYSPFDISLAFLL
jgi:hypothetical protein